MTDKEIFQQKMQAQLDELKAQVDLLKTKASGASADAQLEMNKHIEALQTRIDDGTVKLSALAQAGKEAWVPMKEGVESAWADLKSAVGDAAAKFKG